MSAAATDHDHTLVYPDEQLYSRITAGKLAMWIFLLSDGFSFGGFLLAYGILRGSSTVWGCTTEELVKKTGCVLEPALGINFTAALTFLLICSSVTMVLSHASMVEGDRKGALKWLGLTVLGGALFLIGQLWEYWGLFGLFGPHHGLLNEGLKFGATHYATTFYCVTGFHGLHVLTGVLYLSAVWIGTSMGKTDANTLEVAGLFWHFVDLVWILVFTFIYLIPN
ncbi:MAG: cytochrome c oxidase subunit 3 [Deltaproteobacteria bacterium]|nr:cytochrome c oxidase subunit 3 [Deltaproteobacteria bacterium]